MTKVVRLGRTPDKNNVFCKIEVENGRLSITGVEAPKANGDAVSCGQICPVIISDYAPGWTPELLGQFWIAWDRWHLNDMRAGSQVQEDWLRANPIPESEYAYPKSYYDVASQKLAEAGLNPDPTGYKYGHAWNTEALPQDVITFLQSLPDTDKTPAWV